MADLLCASAERQAGIYFSAPAGILCCNVPVITPLIIPFPANRPKTWNAVIHRFLHITTKYNVLMLSQNLKEGSRTTFLKPHAKKLRVPAVRPSIILVSHLFLLFIPFFNVLCIASHAVHIIHLCSSDSGSRFAKALPLSGTLLIACGLYRKDSHSIISPRPNSTIPVTRFVVLSFRRFDIAADTSADTSVVTIQSSRAGI